MLCVCAFVWSRLCVSTNVYMAASLCACKYVYVCTWMLSCPLQFHNCKAVVLGKVMYMFVCAFACMHEALFSSHGLYNFKCIKFPFLCPLFLNLYSAIPVTALLITQVALDNLLTKKCLYIFIIFLWFCLWQYVAYNTLSYEKVSVFMCMHVCIVDEHVCLYMCVFVCNGFVLVLTDEKYVWKREMAVIRNFKFKWMHTPPFSISCSLYSAGTGTGVISSLSLIRSKDTLDSMITIKYGIIYKLPEMLLCIIKH